MIDNFAMVNGEEICFISDMYRQNGVRIQVQPEALYSKHGFLIPMTYVAFNVLDYLDGDDSMENCQEGGVKALLITHDGKIQEWIKADAKKASDRLMSKRRAPWGPGVAWVRAGYIETEETLYAAMDFHNNDLRKAAELARSTMREGPSPIHFMEIPKIVEELHKRFPQKGK